MRPHSGDTEPRTADRGSRIAQRSGTRRSPSTTAQIYASAPNVDTFISKQGQLALSQVRGDRARRQHHPVPRDRASPRREHLADDARRRDSKLSRHVAVGHDPATRDRVHELEHGVSPVRSLFGGRHVEDSCRDGAAEH